jgi:hypothetical protein
MITEILESAINEVLFTGRFEISEFQLGKEPYTILKHEFESAVIGAWINIYSINHFRGIPVKMHNNDDAIMYCLKFREPK